MVTRGHESNRKALGLPYSKVPKLKDLTVGMVGIYKKVSSLDTPLYNVVNRDKFEIVHIHAMDKSFPVTVKWLSLGDTSSIAYEEIGEILR